MAEPGYLVVVVDRHGVWKTAPEFHLDRYAAKSAAERMRDGTVPEYYVITFRIMVIDYVSGTMRE